jgi:cysteinyl-tRNA synthetase
MIDLVRRLEERGVAYQADDRSVYFAIARFPGYGRLSRLDTREIKAGARVLQDEYGKENPQDFALWKAATEADERAGAAWDSPWGRGRPGWHLECSAMAMSILGETIDLHCGGIDLVFPHHEDEIAQSEAATGKPFSRAWCHGEFLQVDGSKMAKRLGNSVTVRALPRAGLLGGAIRHFVFGTPLSQAAQPHRTRRSTRRGRGRARRRVRRRGWRAPGAAPRARRGGRRRRARGARGAVRRPERARGARRPCSPFVRRANAELDPGGDDPTRSTRPAARSRRSTASSIWSPSARRRTTRSARGSRSGSRRGGPPAPGATSRRPTRSAARSTRAASSSRTRRRGRPGGGGSPAVRSTRAAAGPPAVALA